LLLNNKHFTQATAFLQEKIMTKSKTSVSKIFVWILLGFLFVGLIGFGTGNLSGNVKTIGKIGDTDITVNQYVRALQSELRNTSQQFGQQLTLQQLQAFGIQQRVLSRLVTDKLLENEATKLSLSVDDKSVRDNIISLNAFKGPDGAFNQDAYNYALENAGYTSAEFEEEIRAETARNILSQSILSGNTINKIQAELLAAFLLEARSFNIQVLTADSVDFIAQNPTDLELQEFLDKNTEQYTVPESKMISYAILEPEMLADSVPIDNGILQNIYEEKKSEYNKPEERTIDRLSFLSADEASSAISKIKNNDTDFDELSLERGLTEDDVAYGTFSKEKLADASEEIFSAKIGEVVGPIETDLGAVIFRVREIVAAESTSFDDAKNSLAKEYALSEAKKLVDEKIEESQNLLAAGGTLEDLVSEVGFKIEKILFNEETDIPVLKDQTFARSAQNTEIGEFPEIKELSNGGLFALRVDDLVAARTKNIEEVRSELESAIEKQKIQIKLDQTANDLLKNNQYKGEILSFNDKTRDATLPDMPENVITEIFNLEIGKGKVVSGDQKSYILRLKNVSEADLSTDNAKLLISQIKNQINNSLSADLFESFANMARINSKLDINEQALNAVHSSFQ
jgi:peptidyl-prolyl cis-trans isomerase D